MQFEVLRWTSKPLLLSAVLGVIAAAGAFMQYPSPARPQPSAAPAGRAMMQLLRDEHETMRIFLAEQDAKIRAAAAIESEPEPEQSIVIAEAEPESVPASAASAKRPLPRQVRLSKAAVSAPLSILPPAPPIVAAQLPPPAAMPPRTAHGYGWVHDAYRLPRRLWAAVGELIDDRGPPVPPRPIPPV